LPKGFSLFLGRRIGDCLRYFDFKHRAVAYSNVKAAFGQNLPPAELKKIIKGFYRNFGQNLVEIFFIPLIDKEYLKKYVSIDGQDYIAQGFNRGKGIIFLVVHEGSWELSNIISANLGVPFVLFVRRQRYPRLNSLLDSYRRQKGCRVIQREVNLRDLIGVIKNNESVGMTVDQGGKGGTLVDFFGKEASMATGAVKLALKYDVTILPAYFVRLSGLKHKVIINPPFQIKRTGVLEEDIRNNLGALVKIFEKWITVHPTEHLWTYKIWKYSRTKNILILNDGKTGHLRQSEAVAGILERCLKEKGMNVSLEMSSLDFKNKLSRVAFTISGCFSGKSHCQGCLWCLRRFLRADSYKNLVSFKPDFVISCGAQTAGVNYLLSCESRAKSIVVMRPSIFSVRKFDLVIIPRHDHPPTRKNVAITEGALNLIDENYLKEQSKKLTAAIGHALNVKSFYVGLLIGGDTKDFKLSKDSVKIIIDQIKCLAEKTDVGVLATTSRRTPLEVERLVKEEFNGYANLSLLVIANEKNFPFTIGGILGLAQAVIVSPESISMISEAAASGRYVIVYKSKVSRRHLEFLNYLADKKYIYFVEPEEVSGVVEKIFKERPKINTLEDRIIVRNALEKIL